MSATSYINHLDATEPRWFAVRTRSKSEKLVKRMLEKKGIHAYLPIQQFMRKYTRSTRLVEKPLINCYVFVHITKGAYLPVLETDNVTGFVRFNKDLISIPQVEIDVIRRITFETGLDVETIVSDYSEGEWVEIAAGTLLGLKGKVVKREGKRKFQIELASLGMSLLISVDAAFLERLPAGTAAAFSG
jgi:transcription antitermination factor NusG